MKKFIVVIMLALCALPLAGCQKKMKIESANSELTKVYFIASADGANGSISIGEREEEYKVDGIHTKNCNFSLITLKFNQQLLENAIDVMLKVNEKEEMISLELNPANHCYMADIGYSLSEKDEVKIEYQDYLFSFENASNNFMFGYKDVIDLAIKEFGSSLDCFYQGGSFKGECYLMVLTEFEKPEDVFWVYTIVGENKESHRIVINAYNGSVIIKE